MPNVALNIIVGPLASLHFSVSTCDFNATKKRPRERICSCGALETAIHHNYILRTSEGGSFKRENVFLFHGDNLK